MLSAIDDLHNLQKFITHQHLQFLPSLLLEVHVEFVLKVAYFTLFLYTDML